MTKPGAAALAMRPSMAVSFLAALLLAAAMMVALMASTAHSAPALERYHNETFGFGLELPEALLEEYRAAVSPEGITLTSPDGKAVVDIFGSPNEAGKSLAAVVDQFRSEMPDARITYEWRGRRAAVLSGYQDGDVFYIRIEMSPDRSRVAVLNMVYARDLKRQLDPVVARLSSSLSFR